MSSLAQLIHQQHAGILARWTERVRASASEKGLTTPGRQKVMTSYLSALADEDSGAVAARRRLLESHLSSRVRLGYALPEIVEEILELGTSIAEVGAQLPAGERPDAAVLAPVLAELRHAATTASDIFWEYLREDEQLEKSLLRRVQAIASASRSDPTPAGGFIARLEEVLSVIAEGIPARCLAIALANGELSTAASVGEGAGACRQASTSGLGSVLDEAASGHAGSAIERTVQRDQVVAVRLPEHGDAVGVLYAVRVDPFTAREARRLEAIGALVAVLLENAHLYATSPNARGGSSSASSPAWTGRIGW